MRLDAPQRPTLDIGAQQSVPHPGCTLRRCTQTQARARETEAARGPHSQSGGVVRPLPCSPSLRVSGSLRPAHAACRSSQAPRRRQRRSAPSTADAETAAAGAETVGCAPGDTLDFAFYTGFAPISYSDSDDSSGGESEVHAGYAADLLTALEAMDGAGLRFRRIPVSEWSDIWLLPASGAADIAGGGMSILESRTRNEAGDEVVAFTNGHISYRQSLLVRAGEGEDSRLFGSHGATAWDRFVTTKTRALWSDADHGCERFSRPTAFTREAWSLQTERAYRITSRDSEAVSIGHDSSACVGSAPRLRIRRRSAYALAAGDTTRHADMIAHPAADSYRRWVAGRRSARRFGGGRWTPEPATPTCWIA